MTNDKNIRPVMLVIMDGWGWREEEKGNAVKLAKTPNLDRYGEKYPFTLLKASGEAVGLPEGQMGNSEVGHMNLGAGRIVYQDLTRINKAIEDGSFFKNKVLIELMERVKKRGSVLHLMGLVSDGGVHSQMEHLFASIKMARDHGVKDIIVHAFLDGRDTPPTSGVEHISRLLKEMEELKAGRIGSLIGRFYAMDRDKRWDRIEKAFRALVLAEGRYEKDPISALKSAYDRGETDEFIKPIVIVDDNGNPLPRVSDGDGVLFFNFRADRARELTRAFTEEGFSEFDVSYRPKLEIYVTMTMYDEHFDLPVAFPPQHLKNILGEVVSDAGLFQLRIAETEKYAHVTYFFNGGDENAFDGEERVLIPSPREVPTYDLKPEMSAYKIADELMRRIKTQKYKLIVVNFANGDMVGHTGVLEAAIKACEAVDECVGNVVELWRSMGGAAFVTADHGNAEIMIDENGGPHTAHTTSPVPVYLIDDTRIGVSLDKGILADVAPTLLHMMGLSIPKEMTGKVLIKE